MIKVRPLPEEFINLLQMKDDWLVELYLELRKIILEKHPKANELLYHTHALTSVFTVSEKMSDGFCLIPIYKAHLNFGFQRGTLLQDSNNLLEGTGKLMRHIPIKSIQHLKKEGISTLLNDAYQLALEDAGDHIDLKGVTISKIK